MNKQERIEYANKRIKSNNAFTYCGPRFLYKYRPFDKYSFEMLENNEVFLCAAENLDDETECDVTLSMDEYYEFKNNKLKRLCIVKILELLKPYCSDADFEMVQNAVFGITLRDGTIRRNFLIDLYPELERYCPSANITTVINLLSMAPDKLNDPRMQSQFETLVRLSVRAKKELGICSLSENNDIEYMWDNYANKTSGYCVEYDMDLYENGSFVLPVIYDEFRNKKVAMVLLEDFIGQYVIALSSGNANVDVSQYLRLFISKDLKWEYQNEWRILGDANTKVIAPRISKIIVGKNATDENKKKMIDYCIRNNIPFEIKMS